MKFFQYLLVLSVSLLLLSCAEKMPIPMNDQDGLLVVLTEGKGSSARFLYQTKFYTDADDPNDAFKVRVKWKKSFVSFKMSPGKYAVNAYAVIGADVGRSLATNKKVTKIDIQKPILFKIAPGKITYFPIKVLGINESRGIDSWVQYTKFKAATEIVIRDHKLKEVENYDKWQ